MRETCDCNDCKQDRVTARHVAEALARSELAAAEERGRRRGVEERDRLKAALRDAAAALTLAGQELIRRLNEKRERMSTTEAVNDEVAEAVVRAVGEIRKALAPRDSGKVTAEWLTEIAKDADDTGFAPAMNPARICRCGVVTGGHVIHAPTCFMADRK